MQKEFLDVLHDITGDKEIKDKYKASEQTSSCEEEDNQKCICSHSINHLHYIQHIKTGIIIQVGSSCIHKVDQKLYKALINGVCKVCKEAIESMRKNVNKNGFCSDVCSEEFARIERKKQYDIRMKDEESSSDEDVECDICNDTGISYWTDDIYGPCLEKKVIKQPTNHLCNCGKIKGKDRMGKYYSSCYTCYDRKMINICSCGKKIASNFRKCYACFSKSKNEFFKAPTG